MTILDFDPAPGRKTMRHIVAGHIDVDSGLIVLGDPCNVLDDVARKRLNARILKDMLGDDPATAFLQQIGGDPETISAGAKMLVEIVKKTMADGGTTESDDDEDDREGRRIVVRTPAGDGEYPVYATVNPAGDVVGLYIDLDPLGFAGLMTGLQELMATSEKP